MCETNCLLAKHRTVKEHALRKDIAEMEIYSHNFCGSFQNDNENYILPVT